MRDKLIELICNCPSKIMGANMFLEKISADLADYLLANGVIVPPCKKGDTIYVILYAPISQRYHIKETIAGNVHSINAHWYVECHENSHKLMFGERAFVSKEEAEQALKGGEG